MTSTASGIYCIRNLVNNKRYIGSSVNLKNRRREHFKDLRLNKHHCVALQRAFNKYGMGNFIFEIIMHVKNKKKLLFFEQKCMDAYSPEYNTSKVAGSCLGVKHSKEAVLKNSLNNRGEKNAKAKLKDSDIFIIIELSKHENISHIAKKYNVSTHAISRVLNNKSFKHIKRESFPVVNKIYTKEGVDKLRKLANKRRNRAIPIIVYDKNDNLIGEYPSCNEFCNAVGDYSIACICANLKQENKDRLKYKVYYK